MTRFRLIAAALLLAVCSGGSAALAAPPAASVRDEFDTVVADTKAAMQISPDKALASAQRAEAVANRLHGTRRAIAKATAKWLGGEAYLRLNDTEHAGPLLEEALALVVKVDKPTKLNGDLLLSLGGLYSAKADVASALGAYQKAHNIFRDLGETRSQAIALVCISNLYQDAEDYANALKYNDEALEVYRGDPGLLFSIYANLGIIQHQLGHVGEAQAHFDKALKLARELESPVLEARVLRNLARSQLEAGQIDRADGTIAEGMRVASGADVAGARSHFLELSAQSAYLHHRYAEAARLITRSFAGVDLATTTLDMRDGHKAAYEIYHRVGDEHASLLHLEALKRLDDQTSKLSASANTALVAARFDFANQKTRIAQLRQAQLQRDVDDAKLRANVQLMVFVGLAAATVAIVALLGFGLITIRRSRNEVRAANIDLAAINEALGKALAAKTEFLATTSHEIRTPLNGILGMTQVMLADATLAAPLRERLSVVHGAGVTMRALVNDILDVAKMESGNLAIERAPFDLPAALHEVARLWEEQARAKGLGFVVELDACPRFVEGDAARLRQIVFNLLSNALKFTETGTVVFRAEQGGSAERPLLVLTIRDSGIGIAPEKLDLIFESFRQADAGTTRKFGGTGLGLAICRNLARAMDGDVTVASTPGAGSTFTLTWPLHLAAMPETPPPADDEPAALLILDRNPIARAMLRAVLEPRAGRVLFADTVEAALALIGQGGIARLLVDEATIAGDEALAALSALAATGVPLALLWHAPEDAEIARFHAAGVERVIAKPIAGAALAARLFERAETYNPVTQHLATHAA